MKVLAVYRSDTLEPIAISIPDGLVEAVEKALSEGRDLTLKGKLIPNRLIINQDHLFDSIEEYRTVKQTLSPTKKEAAVEVSRQKTMSELFEQSRAEGWYQKSRKQRRGL